MDDWAKGFGVGLLIMFILGLGLAVITYRDGFFDGYKSGQSDALKGKFEYKLITVNQVEKIK